MNEEGTGGRGGRITGLAAVAVYGAVLAGLLGLFIAFISLMDRDRMGMAAGAAVAALGFGLAANALLRR